MGKKYDLSVYIDVIEHVKDYKKFLNEFSQLSEKAVISTPNRDRCLSSLRKPDYEHYVLKFNVGELYFIIKMYYKKVILFSLLVPYVANMTRVGLYSSYTKLLAECER